MKTLLMATALIAGFATFWVYLWWSKPCYVQRGVCEVFPPNIKCAMTKMGPCHDYRFWEGSKRLEVNTGDGVWQRLRY